ncbi:UBAC2-like protein, partial [Mya arenaria]
MALAPQCKETILVQMWGHLAACIGDINGLHRVKVNAGSAWEGGSVNLSHLVRDSCKGRGKGKSFSPCNEILACEGGSVNLSHLVRDSCKGRGKGKSFSPCMRFLQGKGKSFSPCMGFLQGKGYIFLSMNEILEQAPVCKFLLGSAIGSSLLLQLPLKQFQGYFIYTHTSLFDKGQVWRILTSKLAFLDLKDLFVCSLLIYYFRVFEKRFGSRKFSSYLLGSALVSTILEVLAVYACRTLEIPIGPLPTGPLCLIYPMFVPFYCDIPRVPLSHIWGVPMTGKSISYILGLQAASSSPGSMVVAICGLNLVNGPGIFGAINNNRDGGVRYRNLEENGQEPAVVSEDQVRQLVEMGFLDNQ